MKRLPQSTQSEEEKVFLIGLQTGTMRREDAEASFAELMRLAESTSGEIVGTELVQVRLPDPATFLTKGHVARLGEAMAAADAGTAIVDADVSPSQQKHLEERWKVKLLNRSELILDIFAARAHTSDGKLQVELAQHRYRLPRLRGQGVALSRLGGGIGTRGPGEMKLEVDRRAIERRIHTLEEKIAKLKRTRATQRARRGASGVPVVALVGYTNAGKSTLLNALTGSGAFVEDKLFATLDPTARRTTLASGLEIVFIDTVGFINRLPTQLAAAFRATLEEVLYADVLIHVIDASSPRWEREYEVTRQVLEDLGAGRLPRLTVWNKIDALAEDEPLEIVERRVSGGLGISALKGTRLDRLKGSLEALINETRPRVWMKFPQDAYGEMSELERNATVHERRHEADGVYLEVSSSPGLLARHRQRQCAGPPEGAETSRAAVRPV
jgi:GTP-binding protein HflX